MQKRTALIGTLVSLLPIGQPLVIGTGTALTSAAVMLTVPKKVNAQITRLTCDMKTHVKKWDDSYWKDLSNMKFFININRNDRRIVIKRNIFYQGKNQELKQNYFILSNSNKKLVAIENDFLTVTGRGPYVSSLALDLDLNKLTYASHMNDERGYSFSLYYGRCD